MFNKTAPDGPMCAITSKFDFGNARKGAVFTRSSLPCYEELPATSTSPRATAAFPWVDVHNFTSKRGVKPNRLS